MSLVTWNRLSSDDQTLIEECALEASTYQRTLWREQEARTRSIARVKGVIFSRLPHEDRQRLEQVANETFQKYDQENEELINKIKETNHPIHP
jgi:TRAP-type C4-dicarboxylate transport system substrate-binding protein